MAADRQSEPRELVGVLPAAGTATRLGRLPCSKEILPVGLVGDDAGHRRLRVAVEDALDALWAAGVQRAVIVLAPGKEDVRHYLGDGADRGLELAYETLSDSPGSPWSVNAARDQIGDADTALVFPDIRFEPLTALTELRRAAAAGSADLWLALVPSTRGDKVDLVQTDEEGRVTAIDIKPGAGHEGWTWVTALWRPRFADFLQQRLAASTPGAAERHVGDFINEAIAAGFEARTLRFPDGAARDIGTPEDLAQAWRTEERP
jgi:glucose-1-phosphate thymidylyltransferase